MLPLKRIISFFRTVFSHEKEDELHHKKVGYVVDQLKFIADVIENYKLTTVILSLDIVSKEELERIKSELDRRDNIMYKIEKKQDQIILYISIN